MATNQKSDSVLDLRRSKPHWYDARGVCRRLIAT
jgi:hypothetical protein